MQQFTDRQWLLINIANLYGLDNRVWDQRLSWAEDNFGMLEGFIDTARKPYQYTAAVKDLRAAQAGKPIGTLIGLDANTSGIAIMSILEHCKKTAKQCNLMNPLKYYDAYGTIARKFNKTRDELKIPIMTTFYSSVAEPRDLLQDDYPAFIKLLQKVLPGAWNVKESLESMHREDIDHVEWVLPDGHTAHVKHFEVEEYRIELPDSGSFTYAIREQQPTENYRKLSPNIIHSLDSWIVREMVRICNFEMLPIHDAYYTTPCNLNQMRQNYLNILVRLAEWDPSKMFSQIEGEQVTWHKKDNNFVEKLKRAEYALN